MLFWVANFLLILFFVFSLGFALSTHKVTMFLMNLAGAAGSALLLALDFTGLQTKWSLSVFWAAVTVVLFYDFWILLRELRSEASSRFQRPEVWRRFLESREYRMITSEDRMLKELDGREDVSMTEKLQALEMWRLGNEAFLHGNLDEAAEKYNLSVRWCPTCAAWVNLSAVHFERKEYPNVIECSDEAIKLYSDCEEAWVNRALAFLAQGEPGKALKSLEEALLIQPENPDTLTLKANTLRQLGRLEESLADYNKVNDLNPDHMHAWFQKGIALSLLSRLEEAVECFRQAVQLDKHYSPAYYHLANVLNKLDRNEEAVEAYRKALKLQPDFPEAWNNLGIALTKLGRMKEAIKCYRKALAQKEDYHEAWLNSGLANEALGNYAEAVGCYEKFLEIAPENLARHKAIAMKHLEELRSRLGGAEESSGGFGARRRRRKNQEAPAKNSGEELMEEVQPPGERGEEA